MTLTRPHALLVSIRAPAQGATPPALPIGKPGAKFRSAPPRRGRREFLYSVGASNAFRSAPPRRGRPTTVKMFGRSPRFRSAPPRRGRPAAEPAPSLLMSCFDPRPRAGGDSFVSPFPSGAIVSIRAPAQGATRRLRRHGRDAMFRSAPPRRGRPMRPAIHGATRAFRSAPPRRGRRGGRYAEPPIELFRSAPPRRGRHPEPGDVLLLSPSFDPRPRAGGDPRALVFADELGQVSIRAPAQGATEIDMRLHQPRNVSIRAPAQGATAPRLVLGRALRVSIRAPAQGATAGHGAVLPPFVVSIRAPAQGAT